MCGRIALYTTPDRLSRIFDAELALGIDPDGRPSYNIPPTRNILGIVARPTGADIEHLDVDDVDLPATKRMIDLFRWGLIPSLGKDASMGNLLFNARGETVATKPSFRSAFASRRLAVPADGFYEWGQGEGKQRQPHYFQRADGEPLAMAGLWRSEEHTSELQSLRHLVCRLLLEKKLHKCSTQTAPWYFIPAPH